MLSKSQKKAMQEVADEFAASERGVALKSANPPVDIKQAHQEFEAWRLEQNDHPSQAMQKANAVIAEIAKKKNNQALMDELGQQLRDDVAKNLAIEDADKHKKSMEAQGQEAPHDDGNPIADFFGKNKGGLIAGAIGGFLGMMLGGGNPLFGILGFLLMAVIGGHNDPDGIVHQLFGGDQSKKAARLTDKELEKQKQIESGKSPRLREHEQELHNGHTSPAHEYAQYVTGQHPKMPYQEHNPHASFDPGSAAAHRAAHSLGK